MKKIRLFVEGKDARGNKTKAYPEAEHAAIIEKGKAEVIRSEYVQITAMSVDLEAGTFKVRFRVGGYDSKGDFQPDYRVQGGLFVLNSANPKEKDVFDRYVNGKRRFDFDELIDWLVEADAVRRVSHTVWGIENLTGELEES